MKSHNKEETVEQYLAVLDQPNFWRLFVDGYRQDKVVNILDDKTNLSEADYGHLLWVAREPNSLNASRQTAKKLFSSQLSDELTFKFIKEVHHSAYPFEDHLRLSSNYMYEGDRTFGARAKMSEFKWIQTRASKIKDLVKSKELPWKVIFDQDTQLFELKTLWSYEEKIEHYKTLHEKYKQDVINPSLDTLEVIVQFMQDIECMHFFTDGNCRMIDSLFKKELIERGFEPIILFNPNEFDYRKPQELIEEVKKGQQAFKLFIETGLPYDTCVKDETIAQNIAKLSNDSVIIGDEDILFKEFSEFCAIAKDAFNKINKINDPNFTLDLKWNFLSQFLIVKEVFKSIIDLNIDDALKNVNLVPVLLNRLNEDFSNIINQPSFKIIQSFIEYINFGDIINYITNNKNITDKSTISEINEAINSYLDELQELCQKYISDYDVLSLANPLLCHLTKTEQESLKEEIFKQEELSSSFDKTLDLGDEILENNNDVEVSGIAQEETTE